MTSVPQRIAGLSPEKRELLLRRLQTIESQEQDVLLQGQRQAQPLRAYDRTDSTHFPLSFAQQRLWFLDQLEPGSTAYLIPSAYRLLGEALDPQCLDQSLQELIQRHESLHTTFIGREGQPVQVIHPVSGSTPLVIDLQGLQPEHREEIGRAHV